MSNAVLSKRRTGIEGLDEATRGGLPAAGVTLVVGDAGAGKTILGLQTIANAVNEDNAGVFLSFEESTEQLRRDVASFEWGDRLTGSPSCQLIDARPQPGARGAGEFDLSVVKSLIEQAAGDGQASWVVLDGIDRLLRLHPDRHQALDLIMDINDWVQGRQLSLLLTSKADGDGARQLEGIEFLLDTIIRLSTELVHGRLNRRFRVAKYRGSGHVTDSLPMVVDDKGLHIPYGDNPQIQFSPVSSERLSCGITALDEVLGGGVYRGSTVLISGQPGTAKTSLAAAFADATARRGETVLYLSFDEFADRIVRNVASVGIDLQHHIDAGRLHLYSREAGRHLVEEHYIAVSRLLAAIQPDCLVIDPISALLKSASAESGHVASERLLNLARIHGITSVMTSLSEDDVPESEASLSHTSTLADTWIALGYMVRGGERNRSLSVVKSRGTAHSNQVRELLLSGQGIDLAEVYQYGTEVLMGTARLQKESEELAAERERRWQREQRHAELERELEQARQRLRSAESETRQLEERLELEKRSASDHDAAIARHDEDIRLRRQPGSEPRDQAGHAADGEEQGGEE